MSPSVLFVCVKNGGNSQMATRSTASWFSAPKR